jgi:hypothetical protein
MEPTLAERLERIEAALAQLQSQMNQLSKGLDAATDKGGRSAQRHRPCDLDYIFGREGR